MKSKKKTILSKIVIASAVFLMFSMCIVPASATALPGNNETMITMTNGAYYNPSGDDYYFGFTKDGGGLKAIHISDSPEYNKKSGENYGNNDLNGSFYITDTSKDPGYSDSAILLFGVPDGTLSEDFSLQITASGYNWVPTGDGEFPDIDNNDHLTNVNIGNFGRDNFTYVDDFKPYFDTDYPLYYGASSQDYKLMFIDLSLGTLNRTFQDTLIDNGSIKIDYIIDADEYSGNALFDVYTWCNQSKQGQGVSWTNKIATGGSDWTIGF